jgi:hypothetical protein
MVLVDEFDLPEPGDVPSKPKKPKRPKRGTRKVDVTGSASNVTGKQAKFGSAFGPGTALEVTATSTGVKEVVRLDSRPAEGESYWV